MSGWIELPASAVVDGPKHTPVPAAPDMPPCYVRADDILAITPMTLKDRDDLPDDPDLAWMRDTVLTGVTLRQDQIALKANTVVLTSLTTKDVMARIQRATRCSVEGEGW